MTIDDRTNDRSTTVAVLGLGPMGRALAAAFQAAGRPITGWNRTPGRADDLAGVRIAATADEAVADADLVVVCVLDYAAAEAILEGIGTDWAGKVLVNLTSGDPEQARAAASRAGRRGIAYLDGAILTPTPAIGTPAAAVLYSGPASVYDDARKALAGLGGTSRHVGEDPGRAKAYDVALLDLFAHSVHGLVHSFTLAAAEDIPPTELAGLATGIGALLPEMVTRFADEITRGTHPGTRSTIASAKSGMDHIIATAERHGLDAGALRAARRVAESAIGRGHGERGLSGLAAELSRP